jgi:hypothetical protein
MINQISMVFSGATSSFTLASPWLPRSSGKGGESGGKLVMRIKKKHNISMALPHAERAQRAGTLQRERPQDQGVAVLGGPERPGPTPAAAPAAAGVGGGGGADHHLALQVHRLVGPKELEGPEGEAGVALGARVVGLVGAVYAASSGRQNKRVCMS